MLPAMRVALVVPAAGSGQRLGLQLPKALADLAGLALLRRTLDRFVGACEFVETIVLAPAASVARFEAVVAGTAASLGRVRVIAGGATRQQSVAAGIAALASDIELICVHDAARPLIDASTIAAVIAAAAEFGAATVASRPSDSVREDRDGGGSAALDRTRLWLVETPQAFRRDLLVRAHEQAAREGGTFSDDGSLVEAIGQPLAIVEGGGRNLKVTVLEDLAMAAALLERR